MSSSTKVDPLTFRISLSVLNHLGRNLYRSFATVLGEAISNAWDADAENVWIYVDRKKNQLTIQDDGEGMTESDFRSKFLKIGFSKRKENVHRSRGGRPYIGRKGIGKLALLSCADRITVVTKTKTTGFVGGTIDNKGLDQAITDDLEPSDYPLAGWNMSEFAGLTDRSDHGTIIRLDGFKGGLRHRPEYLRKIIALFFRFSLLDDQFNIYVDDQLVTLSDLRVLAEKTQFLWRINEFKDPFIDEHLLNLANGDFVQMEGDIEGFVASVKKPGDLKIRETDERVSVDLFVNGRVRERGILKHIPTAQIPESYFYGQIHYNGLDDENDRFASSREGIVADDPKYEAFLENLRKRILKMIQQWDNWRQKEDDPGDPENMSITPKQRKSKELFGEVAKEFKPAGKSAAAEKVKSWLVDLSADAAYNYESYAECFVAENLTREYIRDRAIPLIGKAAEQVMEFRKKEKDSKDAGNISIEIRSKPDDLSYLDMDGLANLADKNKDGKLDARLARDAKEYKPMRNAVAHTARLSENGKARLTSVFENIKARVQALLSE